MLDVVARIREYNAGRDPERLGLKYRKMRMDAFTFMRGSCSLFQQRLPDEAVLKNAPLTWICGDLHLENFGSFKAADGRVYFDVNDYDETALAPCTLDLVRFLASLWVARKSLGLKRVQTRKLCSVFLNAYAQALAQGEARALGRDRAKGVVGRLLDRLEERRLCDFLDSRTERRGDGRVIRVDGEKALQASAAQRLSVGACLREFARSQAQPARFNVLDVARRLAGTGSLGVERYVILVEGDGLPDRAALLDLKASRPSCVLPGLSPRQPEWESQAHRIAAVQQRVRAAPLPLLCPLFLDETPCVLRFLQPSEDRVALDECQKISKIEGLIRSMAKTVAWGHLRTAGWRGAAQPRDFAAFSEMLHEPKALQSVAEESAYRVRQDWKIFASAYDDGAF